MTRKRFITLAVTFLLIGAGCSTLSERSTSTPAPASSPSNLPKNPFTRLHLALGNPSQASTTDPDNYLLEKPQYTLSYNRTKGIPNWASWQLNASWLGDAERQDNFRPDDSLPTGWYRVRPTDYSGSGYDRGHLTPSADRTKTIADNSSTFQMTNMIPQAPDNNRNTWGNLEEYCRELVGEGKELYIIAGGSGSRGMLKGKITIPAQTWKVVVVLERQGLGIRGVTSNTRVIAVTIPNSQGINSDWRRYRVSVDKVEADTGYDFLSNISPTIQKVLESQIDSQ